jgi:hypothetical protein
MEIQKTTEEHLKSMTDFYDGKNDIGNAIANSLYQQNLANHG